MSIYSYMLLLLLLTVTVPSSKSKPDSIDQAELQSAIRDMRSKYYYGFVMLLEMLLNSPNYTALQGPDVTFLMPDDEELSVLSISPDGLTDFMLNHSIPRCMNYEDFAHMPAGTMIPTNLPRNMLRIITDRSAHVFVNQARIVAPDLCSAGTIKCHGLNRILSDIRSIKKPIRKLPVPQENTTKTTGPGSPPNRVDDDDDDQD
ncbi:uncharacterized protein LOC113351645 [Papaver somniferum]|uniref:uncharacterized protein LOC113351645 n=1 Tax=Papaver somniferum TaxID=3469 RepID=UPI000E6F79F7|nr:uncharacterized protein LOC113351645 [Papaver somniferum]